MTNILRVAAAVLLIGCADSRSGGDAGGDRQDGGGSSADTCVAACEALAESCGGSVSCESTCRTVAALAERAGCSAEQEAVFACQLDNSHACGTDLAVLCSDEEEALTACSRSFCDADPTDAFCVQTCVSLCERQAYDCFYDDSDCRGYCEQSTTVVEETGCGAEFFDRLACGQRNTACSDAELEARCRSQLDAEDRCFCEAYPSDAYCAGT